MGESARRCTVDCVGVAFYTFIMQTGTFGRMQDGGQIIANYLAGEE
jgi:hypothetical protein